MLHRSVWLVAIFGLTSSNVLDKEFEVYTADSSIQQLFAYKADTVCIVERRKENLHVRLQRLRTFERTSPIKVHDDDRLSDHRPDACFELDGVSYLILRHLHRNITTLVVGQEHRTLDLNYELLRYDYTDQSVYVFANHAVKKYDARQLIESNATVKPLEALIIPMSFNDAIVTEGRIFLIHQRILYEYKADGTFPVVDEAAQDTFWFQLFSKKSLFCLTDMSSTLSYLLQFALLLFIIYCLKYKMTVRTVQNNPVTYEFTPIVKK
ncbi:hypothetical protein AAVH_31985 [Aphelenchoides avenae]|nr:hypothetical protein AAVH_31985 [Aphelenchus avenae]